MYHSLRAAAQAKAEVFHRLHVAPQAKAAPTLHQTVEAVPILQATAHREAARREAARREAAGVRLQAAIPRADADRLLSTT